MFGGALMKKVLIIEDDKNINEMLQELLSNNGYNVSTAYSGTEALLIHNKQIDLIILDLMLPGKNGEEIIKKLKTINDVPIIITTAINDIDKKLDLFELGADDYITKPFINEELVARVKAHIRREERIEKNKNNNFITIGEIKINKESFEVYKNDTLITLSTKEFELLAYLMENAGIVLSKEQIYQSVWKNNYGDIGTVAVNIKSLRNKLDKEEKYIKTIWGMGYKFVKVV